MSTGWSKPPTAFIKVVEKDLEQKRHQIAVETLGAVISGSPVDTGAYRANHRVSVDGVDLGYDLGLGLGKDREPPKGATTGVVSYGEGLEQIAGAEGPYREVVIQNNLPYSGEIEHGHSDQAPDGVYELAFLSIVEKHTK